MAKVKPRIFFQRKQGKEDSKKKKKTVELPSIYRRFTEVYAYAKRHWVLIAWKGLFSALFLLLLSGIAITSFTLYSNLEKKEKTDREKQQVIAQVYYWEGVVKKYKGYRDGYFQLAVLEYQLGNKEKAKEYIKQALLLDPNFEEGRKLEKILSN